MEGTYMYLFNHPFTNVQLIISLSVCIVRIQLLHVVARKPRPMSTDMLRHVHIECHPCDCKAQIPIMILNQPFYSLEKQVLWC